MIPEGMYIINQCVLYIGNCGMYIYSPISLKVFKNNNNNEITYELSMIHLFYCNLIAQILCIFFRETYMISGFTKLHMGLVVQVKKMSVLINFYCKIPILCQSLAKFAQILLVMSDRTDTFCDFCDLFVLTLVLTFNMQIFYTQ